MKFKDKIRGQFKTQNAWSLEFKGRQFLHLSSHLKHRVRHVSSHFKCFLNDHCMSKYKLESEDLANACNLLRGKPEHLRPSGRSYSWIRWPLLRYLYFERPDARKPCWPQNFNNFCCCHDKYRLIWHHGFNVLWSLVRGFVSSALQSSGDQSEDKSSPSFYLDLFLDIL